MAEEVYMAIKILTRHAFNLAAIYIVLIFFPQSAGAQQLMNEVLKTRNTFAAITPGMNAARDYATETLLRNGKVLIAGGTNDGNTSLSSTELYNPATNKFSASPPAMNIGRVGATATLLRDGEVLIAGGYGSTEILSSTELYNPSTNKFAPAASTPVMNTAREQATATLLPDGKVLIAGGDGNGFPYWLDSTEIYDPATRTFAASNETAAMNTARSFATATLLRNGKVLIAGGTDNVGSLSSTELYDPHTNSFAVSTPAMNSPREYATATLLHDGKVLIAGGEVAFEDVLGSTDLYDPATNSFVASTPVMNYGRIFATATLLNNGKVLIAGGQDLIASHLYNSLRSTDLYDPATDTFAASASTPVMNIARDQATATALRNGKVLIAGGESSVGAPPNYSILSSTELYSPAQR
jgi:Galactose oxidase, central domain/Kelch motif